MNKSLFAIDDDLAALMDTAEGIDGPLPQELEQAIVQTFEARLRKIDGCAAFIRAKEAEAKTALDEIKRLEDRKRAAENAVQRLKGLLLWFMRERGITKIEGQNCTVRRQSNGGVVPLVIDDESKLPAWSKTASVSIPVDEWDILVKQVPSLAGYKVSYSVNPVVIRREIESAEQVPGASLGERGEHIRIA